MKANVIRLSVVRYGGPPDPKEPPPVPGKFLVTMRRPDGTTGYMHVDNEHYDRVRELASGEFGDRSILGIPDLDQP